MTARDGSGFAPFVGATPTASPIDRASTVAIVAGEPALTRAELDARLQEMVERYERLPEGNRTTPTWRNQRRRRIIQTAVHDAVLRQHVATTPVELTTEQVEAAARETLGHVFDDERLLQRYLHSRNQTREEYLEAQRVVLAEDTILERRGPLEPAEAEIQEFYERNRERWNEAERVLARTVTVRLRQNANEQQIAEARARIDALRDRIANGEDFATVAREASESADRMRGGDMGWLVRGRRREMVDNGVEDVLFRAEVGTRTEVLRTHLGFQFFEVLDKRAAGVRGLDEVTDSIREPLRRRKRDRLRAELVNELLESVAVEYIEANFGLEPETDAAGTPDETIVPE